MIKITGIDKKLSLKIQSKIEKYIKLLRIKSKVDKTDIIVKFVKKYPNFKSDTRAAYMVHITKRLNSEIRYHEIVIRKDCLLINCYQ